MLSQRCRSTVAFVALICVTACTTWEPYVLERGTTLPTRIRAHLADGEAVTLRSPLVSGDSALIGRVGSSSHVRTVPLRVVESLEERRASLGKSILLLGAVGMALPLLFVGGLYIFGCDGC